MGPAYIKNVEYFFRDTKLDNSDDVIKKMNLDFPARGLNYQVNNINIGEYIRPGIDMELFVNYNYQKDDFEILQNIYNKYLDIKIEFCSTYKVTDCWTSCSICESKRNK